MSRCEVRPELDFGSDHLPIRTSLEWSWEELKPRRKRAWKRANSEETRRDINTQAAILAGVLDRYLLESHEDIDTYTDMLIMTLQEIADNTIPDIRPFEGSKSYWTADCTRVTKASREALRDYRLCRTAATEGRLQEVDRDKVSTLRKTRTLNYREAVHAASLKKAGVWKLARWGKERSIFPRELPQLPALKDGEGGKATNFEEGKGAQESPFPSPPPG